LHLASPFSFLAVADLSRLRHLLLGLLLQRRPKPSQHLQPVRLLERNHQVLSLSPILLLVAGIKSE
jgi:hypothetical protein